MFQLLVNLMLNNTSKLTEEFQELGGKFCRYEKRKRWFSIFKTSHFSFEYNNIKKIMTIDEVYDVDSNRELNSWLFKAIGEMKND